MVEKIELLNDLSNVELIKLLNVDNLRLEKLIDLKIRIKEVLECENYSVDNSSFEDDFNEFNKVKISSAAKKLVGRVGIMDLIKLIDFESMNFCELLYLDSLVEKGINYKLIVDNEFKINGINNCFSLYNSGIFNFGKIKLVSSDDLMFGVDDKYNFYMGKIYSDMKCILFSVMRKGIPYDLSRDVLVFDGKVTFDGKLDGMWETGEKAIARGLDNIDNIDDSYDYRKINSDVFDVRDLQIAYIACSEDTNTLETLLNRAKNNSGKSLVR